MKKVVAYDVLTSLKILYTKKTAMTALPFVYILVKQN